MIGGDRQAGGQPFTFVMPMLAAVARDQRVIIQNVDAAVILGDAAQLAIDLADESGLPGFGLPRFGLPAFGLGIEHAEARMRGTFERVNNERSLTVLAERVHPLFVPVCDAVGRLARHVGRQVGEFASEVGCDIPRADRENHRVGRETVERTA